MAQVLAEIPRDVLVVIGAGGMEVPIARRLAPGRRLILADFSDELLETGSEAMSNDGHLVDARKVDIANRASVEELAREAAAAGRIETIVLAAGVSLATASPRQIYEVDQLGAAHVIDAFLPVVSPGTSLVCISSMAGHMMPSDWEESQGHMATAPTEKLLEHAAYPQDPASAYCVSKQGNHLRVQASVRAYGLKGARINSISPGVMLTPMGRAESQGVGPEYLQQQVEGSATRRYGTPEIIVNVVAFLAGAEAASITGADLLVDGGAIAGMTWPPA